MNNDTLEFYRPTTEEAEKFFEENGLTKAHGKNWHNNMTTDNWSFQWKGNIYPISNWYSTAKRTIEFLKKSETNNYLPSSSTTQSITSFQTNSALKGLPDNLKLLAESIVELIEGKTKKKSEFNLKITIDLINQLGKRLQTDNSVVIYNSFMELLKKIAGPSADYYDYSYLFSHLSRAINKI